MWSTQNEKKYVRNQSQRSRDHIKEKVASWPLKPSRTTAKRCSIQVMKELADWGYPILQVLCSSSMGFFLYIVFNDKVCWLLKIFQDQSSGCRCTIAFFLNLINKCWKTIILKHLKNVGFLQYRLQTCKYSG